MSNTVKITSRGKYALTAMIRLAQDGGNKPAPLAGLAEQGGISLSYLEQLIAGLRKHGLVKSYRGPGGGYVLARPPADISLTDILRAAEDCTPARRASAKDKAGASSPDPSTGCPLAQNLWNAVGEHLYTTLHKLSLQNIIDRNTSL